MSKEVKGYLCRRGISTNQMMPYDPQGNWQIERTNRNISKTLQLALKSEMSFLLLGITQLGIRLLMKGCLYTI